MRDWLEKNCDSFDGNIFNFGQATVVLQIDQSNELGIKVLSSKLVKEDLKNIIDLLK